MKTILLVLALQVYGAMAVGSYQDKPVDEMTRTMATFAVPHLQSIITGDKFFKLQSVDRTSHQVVSGKNYKIELTLVETTCGQDEHQHEEGVECQSPDQPHTVKCHVTVYDQPWTKTREVTEKHCDEPLRA